MQTVAVSVPGICQSVLSCGMAVQMQLNGSRSSLGWRLGELMIIVIQCNLHQITLAFSNLLILVIYFRSSVRYLP